MNATVAATSDRATGPALKHTARTLTLAARTGESTHAQLADLVRVWRRAGGRDSTTRRPSTRSLRTALNVAAGSPA